MQYPDESTLVARGKYSTLGKERRAQVERVQAICTTLVTAAQAALRDAESIPPVNTGPIATLEACIASLQEAREQIVKVASEMIVIKQVAWPE